MDKPINKIYWASNPKITKEQREKQTIDYIGEKPGQISNKIPKEAVVYQKPKSWTIIEFDKSEGFDKIDAAEATLQTLENLKKDGLNVIQTSHNGFCDWLIIITPELENLSQETIKNYNLNFADRYMPEKYREFVDENLLIKSTVWITRIEQVHWKKQTKHEGKDWKDYTEERIVQEVFPDAINKINKILLGNSNKKINDISILKEGVPIGKRNESAFKLAYDYRKKGNTPDETLVLLVAWNKNNQTPMTEQEIKGCVDSAYSYEKKSINDEFLRYNKKGEVTGVNTDNVADYIINNNSFKTIFWSKGETIYVFNNGIWLSNGRELIETITEQLLQQYTKNSIVWEILGKIKRQTAISIDEFNKIPEGIICIDNGIFNLKESKLYDYSDEYYFKTKIPITYNPDVDCPVIKKFLSEVLYEEDIPVIQEWLGFNLHNIYFEKKSIILHGERSTGKTAFLNLQRNFIGETNITNLSLHKIGIGKSFDLLNLKDKYANIYDDLSSRDLIDIGGFKMATGLSTISGEVKFGDTINFMSFAKLTFAANKIPPVKDIDDDAYYSRWMPIAFDNQISDLEMDKNLIKKLTTKEELSGLFNFALEGLHRLIQNNGFSFYKNPAEVKEIMMRSGHHLSAFEQDVLEKEDGHNISKDEMFVYYTYWCDKNNKARMTKEQLGRQLERFVPYIVAGRGKERHWKNVRLKPSICDTYVTFYKTNAYRENKDNTNNLNVYMYKNKASQVSQEVTDSFDIIRQDGKKFRKVDNTFLPCVSCGEKSKKGWNLEDDQGKIYCDMCAGQL